MNRGPQKRDRADGHSDDPQQSHRRHTGQSFREIGRQRPGRIGQHIIDCQFGTSWRDQSQQGRNGQCRQRKDNFAMMSGQLLPELAEQLQTRARARRFRFAITARFAFALLAALSQFALVFEITLSTSWMGHSPLIVGRRKPIGQSTRCSFLRKSRNSCGHGAMNSSNSPDTGCLIASVSACKPRRL